MRETDTPRLQATWIKGHVEPRIWTPPLRELTPETSYGFDVIDFARDVLHEPLDPWQEWAVIHLGELLEDGRPRFRQLLIIVARQNGKTHLLRVLSLFWQFYEQWPLIVSTSANLETARESWLKAVETAETHPVLSRFIPGGKARRANGQETLTSDNHDGTKSRYLIKAANGTALRGYSVDRLVIDELREHRTMVSWRAAAPTINARPYGQIIAISNQGDDESVVLNSLRDSAIKSIKDETSHLNREGIFEWSAPEHSDISDPAVWAMANPNLGYRLDLDAIKGPAMRALESGGAEEAGFKTEMLCIPVRALDAAVDPKYWSACYKAGKLSPEFSHEEAWGFDVNRLGTHATLVAAFKEDDIVRVQVIAEWRQDQMDNVLSDLTRLLNEYKPRSLTWLPNGPAATYGAELKKARLVPRVLVSELSGEISEAVMGFSAEVSAKRIWHNDDPLLNDHVTSAQKLWRGDRWVFSRKGKGSSDAAYAAAVAWYGAKTQPARKNYKPIGPDD